MEDTHFFLWKVLGIGLLLFVFYAFIVVRKQKKKDINPNGNN